MYKNNRNKNKSNKKNKNKNFKTSTTKVPITKGRTTTFNNESKKTRLKRREFLMDVGSGASSKMGHCFRSVSKSNGLITSIANIAVNAGVVSPWLSTLAGGFEKFLFHALKFDYVPTCATTNEGTVTMAYNSNPSKPETSVEESDYTTKSNSTQTSVWKPTSLALPLSKMQETTRTKLVRKGPLSTEEDANLSDNGIVDILINGASTNTTAVIGKLYVDYDVELLNPRSNSDKVSFIQRTLKVNSELNKFKTMRDGNGNVWTETQFLVEGSTNAANLYFKFTKPSTFFKVQMFMRCSNVMFSQGYSSQTLTNLAYIDGYENELYYDADTGVYSSILYLQTATNVTPSELAIYKTRIGTHTSILDLNFTTVAISVDELTSSEVMNPSKNGTIVKYLYQPTKSSDNTTLGKEIESMKEEISKLKQERELELDMLKHKLSVSGQKPPGI